MSAVRTGAAALLLLAIGCSSVATPEERAPSPTERGAAREPQLDPVPLLEPPHDREPGGIPVLLFHQICSGACGAEDAYGIPQTELRRMLGSLERSGYQTIAMPDFVRAHAGDTAGLPARPILLTFDDGRIDGYRTADPVLEELGYQATMFVITATADAGGHYYMQWPEIVQAATSGRWTMQLHAHAGHVNVPVAMSATGTPSTAPFFANRQCAPGSPRCADLESFEDWQSRVDRDVSLGNALLGARLGLRSFASQSFAVPFSDYGQHHSNEPRIAPALRAYLDAHFEVWFTQPGPDPSFMKPSAVHEVGRFSVHQGTTTEDVEAWLAKHALP